MTRYTWNVTLTARQKRLMLNQLDGGALLSTEMDWDALPYHIQHAIAHGFVQIPE